MFYLWLLDIIQNSRFVLGMLLLFSGIFTFASLLAYIAASEDNDDAEDETNLYKQSKKMFKISLTISIIIIVLLLIIPGDETIALLRDGIVETLK